MKKIILSLTVLLLISAVVYTVARKNRVRAEVTGHSCPKLASLANLRHMAKDKDIVFIVLPGDKEESVEKVRPIIDEAAQELSERGKSAGIFSLERETMDYEKIVRWRNLQTFPAVVLMGKGCRTEVVEGEITKEALMKSYSAAIKPCDKPCDRHKRAKGT